MNGEARCHRCRRRIARTFQTQSLFSPIKRELSTPIISSLPTSDLEEVVQLWLQVCRAGHRLRHLQKVFERNQKKRAKLAFVWSDGIQGVEPEQARKELLGQVFGIVRPVTFAADINIDGIPNRCGKAFRGLLSFEWNLLQPLAR